MNLYTEYLLRCIKCVSVCISFFKTFKRVELKSFDLSFLGLFGRKRSEMDDRLELLEFIICY